MIFLIQKLNSKIAITSNFVLAKLVLILYLSILISKAFILNLLLYFKVCPVVTKLGLPWWHSG